MCVSADVLAEYKEVLNRARFGLSPARIARSLAIIRKTSLLVKPTRTIDMIRDEPDNRLLECAHAARANYLVTGNTKHFPKYFESTAIVTPKQFIDMALPVFVRYRNRAE